MFGYGYAFLFDGDGQPLNVSIGEMLVIGISVIAAILLIGAFA